MAETDATGEEHRADGVSVTRMSLRPGGWIGYSEDAVFVDRDDQRVKIDHDRITQVGLRVVEWDLVVMSLLLVGIGAYVVLRLNPLVGVAFALVGVLSLYYTYRQRYELVIRVENEPKPVTVYPTHPDECHETLVEQIGLERVR